jgi:hypothetical protein
LLDEAASNSGGNFLFCVLALLMAGFVLAWFASWQSDKLAVLDSASEMAETEKRED